MTAWLERLGVIADVLVPFLPPAIIGTFFGDALRKDVLTPRQRAVAFLAMAVFGALAGVSVAREYSLSEYTGAAFAVIISAIGTDLFGLAVAVIRQFRDNPLEFATKIKDFVLSFLPSRKQ